MAEPKAQAAADEVVTAPRDDAPAAITDDYMNYVADMILELQQMTARAGHHALAERLLAAHELARRKPK